MFQRRHSRSRFTANQEVTAAAVELLESKQLLSATNSVDSPGRTITITDPDLLSTEEVRIEEAHLVDGTIWVLTDVRTIPSPSIYNPMLIDMAESFIPRPEHERVSSSIVVDAPEDIPVLEFRIGGAADGAATPVDGFADFAQRLDATDSEVLYSRVNRELSVWREGVRTEMETQADSRYGTVFGTETDQQPDYWYPIINDVIDGVARVFPAVALEFSDTNQQVAGVDEADIVETDGQHIYTLSNGQLVVVAAATTDTESSIVSRTQLSTHSNLAMFLYEGRLTIISQDYVNDYSRHSGAGLAWDIFLPSSSRTVVTVFDVTDPTRPSLQQETVIDGTYQNARAVGDQVYVVINNNEAIPYLPSLRVVRNADSSTGFRYESRSEYSSRLDHVVDQLTPPSVYRRIVAEDGEPAIQRLGWLDGASDEIVTEASQLTTIVQFDTTSTESMPVDNISVRTGRYSAAQIYASTESIYVMTNEWPQAESGGIFARVLRNNSTTAINKIDISGDQMVFDGNGSVPGAIESQFSVDEHNGYLRIVTTTDQWSQQSKNHVYILEDSGEELTVVGSIEDLAPTERVYSARFDGDRAWVVTFRQVDPVFSLDLSDPTNPQVMGELKIPGFSEHLQLIDENHLLAIGRAATEEGRVQGVQVSLFDVSDMASPELLHQRLLDEDQNGWSHSAALHDHQAFNYLPESELLLIPYRDGDSAGLMTLSIDIEDGIEIVGEANSEYTRNVQRSVQIGDFLYAVSHNAVSVVSINDPSNVLYDVSFEDDPQTPHDHRELLREHLQELQGQLNVREYLQENGERIRQVEIGDPAGVIDQAIDDLLEFELSVTDIESGQEIIRRISNGPWFTLQDDGQELLHEGTYEFLVRSRSRLLDNPEWSQWIQNQVVSVGEESPEMISDEVLPELAPLLEWSEVASQVRTILKDDVESFELNPIDHYEVWVTDATIGQMVLRDRSVEGTSLDLDQLDPGKYFSWFRAIHEDGTEADWSPRTSFQINGRPLELLNDFIETADALPDFSWQTIAGATDFEIEIVSPDGTETVYSATDIPDARHEITESLEAGTYTLRVRADLATGVTTDWAETEFTILDRPEVQITDRRLNLRGADGVVEADGSEGVEVWVNKANSFERVFHSVEWTDIENVDFVEAFGLTNQVGDYDIWTRLLGEQNSKWSQKVTFEVFHDAISTTDIGQFATGDVQEFFWEVAPLVESYELYIRKDGQAGAYVHEMGIVGNAIQLAENLPVGDYTYWLRGTLAEGFTRWTEGFDLNVTDQVRQPQLRIDGSILSWDAPVSNSQHHLWINRVDDAGRLIEARVAHVRDMTETSFDLSTLGEGRFSAWVQSSLATTNGEARSDWSERLDLDRTSVIDRVDDLIDQVLGDLLSGLDLF